MRIVFLCGSLELGYDGVGDYTRLLASELIKKGHQSYIISLNDRHVSDPVKCMQRLSQEDVEVLRLPSAYNIKRRIDIAKVWIEELNPDWISLQFVIFAFHPKGVPLKFIEALPKLHGRTKVHIMFHELWVGISEDASFKHVVWGTIQKYLVKRLLKLIKPKLITTQCRLYLQTLGAMGLEVHYMPLFSNVPRQRISISNFSVDNSLRNSNTDLSLVVFGTIHPLARLQEFIHETIRYSKQYSKTVCLTLVGRCGAEQPTWIENWSKAGLPVEVLGEKSTEVISAVLSSAHIGVSTSALPMIDKSGTVAAMIEHNLPVICVGQTWSPRGLKSPAVPEGIFDLAHGCIERCLQYGPSTNNRTRLDITESLINKYKSSI